MAGLMRSIMKAIRDFWRTPSADDNAAPDVVVHDPAAQGPHNLDDPFFDRDVQTRVGDVIAGAVQKKE